MLLTASTASTLRRRHRSIRHAASACIDALEGRRLFSTFSVTTTADGVAGSLRDAIEQANAHANVGGPDLIDFQIPGGGLHTIKPTSALPTLNEAVTIDGFTQAGASANTLAVGNNAVYQIALDGSLVDKGNGLEVAKESATIRGLVISDWHGFLIGLDAGTSGSVIEGNFLGSDATGTQSNGGDNGIEVTQSNNNLIGGTTPASRNLIVGNKGDGVQIVNSSGNIVANNYIGVNAQGTVQRPNGSSGVSLSDGSRSNIIGGASAGAGNIISGNLEDGITIQSGARITGSNWVQGNFIGTDVTGTLRLPNKKDGVRIIDSRENLIGGDTAGARNVISGNDQAGVSVNGDDSEKNVISGNFIGTDASGTSVVFNDGDGIRLENAIFNTIGGTTPGARNLISGNDEDGIELIGDDLSQLPPSNNGIQGNFIGTDISGSKALGNGSNGIGSSGRGFFNVIGGSVAGAGNVISGNDLSGIKLEDSFRSNEISGNMIGTDAAGLAAVPNQDDGIDLFDNADTNIIGGTTPPAKNLISGNLGSGIALFHNRGNMIQGNFIGTDISGASPLPNGEGIEIEDSSDTVVGGSTPEAGNVIAFNGVPEFPTFNSGIDIVSFITPSLNNSIRLNSIFRNSGLGIDLGADRVTNNDATDADDGPNHLQNTPVLASATAVAGGTQVTGVLHSAANRSFLVDYYANTALDLLGAEGQMYLGTLVVTTDANGNASINTTLSTIVPTGQFITATATTVDESPAGNTSEFSAAVKVTGPVLPPPPPVSPPTVSVNSVSVKEGNSGTKTLTFTVKLNKAGTTPVTVNYQTFDGTAKTGDSDYVSKAGTVTFAPGETSKTVSVTIKGDTKVEANETLKLKLSDASGAAIADDHGVGTGTITNDDAAAVLPKLSVSGFSGSEGNSGTKTFTFKVTLDKAAAQPVTVNFATADGIAKAGSDYVARSGALTFAAGETVKSVTVQVKGDVTKEAAEEFFLKLSSPVNATIAVGSGKGTIVNDD